MKLEMFENKKVAIAVSTGVDSMVLLHMLQNINCDVFVVYVRHYHRNNVYIESDFFLKYCKDNNINLTVYDYRHEEGNFESTARNYRYECFKDVYVTNNCDYLLTAHHGDDLVETMLMRQLRGADINSIGGFKGASNMDGMNVVRPLINLSKFELYEYARKHNVPFYEDETNADTSYARNLLRHEVVPKFNGDYIQKFVKLSEEFYEISDYISSIIAPHIIECNDIYLDLKNLDKVLHKYAVKKCFNMLYGSDIVKVTDKHVDLVLNENNNKVMLPNNYYAFINNTSVTFSKCIEEVYNYEYSEDLELNFLNSQLSFKYGEKLFLSDEVVFPLRVINADLNLKIRTTAGSQKLNRVFINAKVPLHKRTSWPVLVDFENKVICIFGIKYSNLCLKPAPHIKFMIQYKCTFKGDDYNG